MKKRLPALILAVGITAMPVLTKANSRRVDSDNYSKVQENKKKRMDNFGKRLKEIEAEKELLRETEAEIAEIVAQPVHVVVEKKSTAKPKETIFKEETRILISDPIPTNGIDLSEIFQKPVDE